RGVLEDVRVRLVERIERAVALVERDRQAAADSLTYVRVGALSEAPEVAEALVGVIERLRRGEAVDSALARVRRALEPAPVRLRRPVECGGLPSAGPRLRLRSSRPGAGRARLRVRRTCSTLLRGTRRE